MRKKVQSRKGNDAMMCNKGYELKPRHSNAGWYIGTFDNDGYPYCRISKDYYFTQELAQKAIDSKTWVPRDSFETNACCGGLLPDSPQIK